MLAEVVFRSSFEPVNTLPQIDLVGVQGKDLLLGKRALDLDGKKNFLQFASEGLLAGEKKVTRQLHGQRRSPLGTAGRSQIVIGGADHAKQVDSPMAFEILILDGNHCLAQYERNGFIGNNDAPLQGEGAEDAAMHIEQVG